LTVIDLQRYLFAEMLFIVKAAAFKPPPKVDSAVIRLTPIEEAGSVDLAGFLRFAGLCFHMKRKTLRNNLTAAYPAALISELPEAGLRAEQLSVVRLMDLYRRVREAVEAAS
ncbi:MAG TPA: rRNA adenine N-6-methyltransferase family protein, partial [Bryobacteraceae bacterium]|nr:rRNA adenine N-6-methyltransferase family protein [Bryobacteraceae bacterium]